MAAVQVDLVGLGWLLWGMDSAKFMSPSSLWSLWVPGLLLGLIVAAAAYFTRTRIR